MKMNTVSSQGNTQLFSTCCVPTLYQELCNIRSGPLCLAITQFFLFFCTTVFILYFLVFFFLTASSSMWDVKFPYQGLNLCPLPWKHGVLTTGPPGWSPSCTFNFLYPVITIFFSVAKDFGFALLCFQDGLETWVNL